SDGAQSNSTSDADIEDHLSERSNDSDTEQQVSDSDADSDSSSYLDLLTLVNKIGKCSKEKMERRGKKHQHYQVYVPDQKILYPIYLV
ncbi:hypothetical protein HHI36_012858, partial [Cryptolaemus montrouzieri]